MPRTHKPNQQEMFLDDLHYTLQDCHLLFPEYKFNLRQKRRIYRLFRRWFIDNLDVTPKPKPPSIKLVAPLSHLGKTLD